MLPEEVASQIVDATWMKFVRLEVRAKESFIIVSGNETDILAIGFVRDAGGLTISRFPDLALRHASKRRHCAPELMLSQTEHEIRLILPGSTPLRSTARSW